jgi:hypothetical protein
MVRDEFGKEESNNANNGGVSNSLSANSSPVFERGRFYEEYSARRNERLSRKKSEDSRNERKSVYNLGVTVESAKRGSTSKKLESLRKSVSAAYSLEPPTPRYMLRSMSKDSKKPPLATTFGKSVIGSERKVGGARRVRRDWVSICLMETEPNLFFVFIYIFVVLICFMLLDFEKMFGGITV